MNKAIFTVPPIVDSRKRTWRKHLTEVRTEKQTGYAFQGEWLYAGERCELPVGSFILSYDEPGSMKNWYPLVRVFQLQSDGNLSEVFHYEGGINQKSWALSVRDSIADLIKGDEETEESEKWVVEYENSVDVNDGFCEWWEITNKEIYFRTDCKSDAEWLCNKLNEG